MYQLDPPPAPSRLDLEDQLAAVNAACRDAADRRQVIESEIRTTQSIPRLAELHDLWQRTIELQDAAHHRQRELLEMLAAVPA